MGDRILQDLDWAAWVSAISTIVLAVITWQYVRLTKAIVDQNQEIAEQNRRQEMSRRRRIAVSLRDDAAKLWQVLSARGVFYPGNQLRRYIEALEDQFASILRLSLEVGAGTEIGALQANTSFGVWLREGRAAADANGDAQEAAYDRAKVALQNAVEALEEIRSAADAFISSGPMKDLRA